MWNPISWALDRLPHSFPRKLVFHLTFLYVCVRVGHTVHEQPRNCQSSYSSWVDGLKVWVSQGRSRMFLHDSLISEASVTFIVVYWILLFKSPLYTHIKNPCQMGGQLFRARFQRKPWYVGPWRVPLVFSQNKSLWVSFLCYYNSYGHENPKKV
jgi:hypothetical protein